MRLRPPKVKTRIELTSASHRHGFPLLSEHSDEYLTPIDFGVDYQAMDPDWPVKGCKQEERLALLKKMHELAQGKFETLVSTRFLFQKKREQRPSFSDLHEPRES